MIESTIGIKIEKELIVYTMAKLPLKDLCKDIDVIAKKTAEIKENFNIPFLFTTSVFFFTKNFL